MEGRERRCATWQEEAGSESESVSGCARREKGLTRDETVDAMTEREGGREGRREGGREGRREGGREGRREGGREGERAPQIARDWAGLDKRDQHRLLLSLGPRYAPPVTLDTVTTHGAVPVAVTLPPSLSLCLCVATNMDRGYWSIDSILADSQKLPCTLNLDVRGLGYLQGNSEPDIQQHTRVELPFWIAELLALQSVARPGWLVWLVWLVWLAWLAGLAGLAGWPG